MKTNKLEIVSYKLRSIKRVITSKSSIVITVDTKMKDFELDGINIPASDYFNVLVRAIASHKLASSCKDQIIKAIDAEIK